MIKCISRRIVGIIVPKDGIAEEQYEICAYGTELLCYSIISTTGLMLIGCLSGMPVETLVIVMTFYLCQTVGGGIHARTHGRCFTLMAIFLGVGIFYLKGVHSSVLYVIPALCSVVYLLCHPLVLHENKRYLEERRIQLEIFSRLLTCTLSMIGVVVFLISPNIAHAWCVGIVISAGSRFGVEIRQICDGTPKPAKCLKKRKKMCHKVSRMREG